MPRAIPAAVRQAIIRRHHEGQDLGQIARDLGLPYDTVRMLWRRYRQRGEAGLAPDYARCGRPEPRSDARMPALACWLKRRHPTWGAP